MAEIPSKMDRFHLLGLFPFSPEVDPRNYFFLQNGWPKCFTGYAVSQPSLTEILGRPHKIPAAVIVVPGRPRKKKPKQTSRHTHTQESF
jgi:hypothetical protein